MDAVHLLWKSHKILTADLKTWGENHSYSSVYPCIKSAPKNSLFSSNREIFGAVFAFADVHLNQWRVLLRARFEGWPCGMRERCKTYQNEMKVRLWSRIRARFSCSVRHDTLVIIRHLYPAHITTVAEIAPVQRQTSQAPNHRQLIPEENNRQIKCFCLLFL